MTNKDKSLQEVLNERGGRYGSFTDNARITQEMWDVFQSGPCFELLSAVHKEAAHMILHKLARSVCGDPMYDDNPKDIAGYAKLWEDSIHEAQEDDALEADLNELNTQHAR